MEEKLKAGLHSLLSSGNNSSTQEGVRRKQQGTVPLRLPQALSRYLATLLYFPQPRKPSPHISAEDILGTFFYPKEEIEKIQSKDLGGNREQPWNGKLQAVKGSLAEMLFGR